MRLNRYFLAFFCALATETLLWVIVTAGGHDIMWRYRARLYTHLPGHLLGFSGVLPKLHSQTQFDFVLSVINLALLFGVWSVVFLFSRRF